MIRKLESAIKAVCPIVGVSVRSFDPLMARIDYAPEATPQQRDAAQAVLLNFNQVQAQAEIAAEEAAEAERQAFLKLIKDKWQNEFIPLRNWARTKGYPG